MIIREAEVVINPVDNVTPSLNRIALFLGRLSGGLIDIKLDDKIFDSFDKLEENLGDLGENLDIKMAVQTDTSAAEDGLKGIETGAEKSTNAVDRVSAAGQQMGNVLQDTGKKSKSAFAAIGNSLGELSNNIGNMTASLAGIAAGGAIAGLSWKAAVESGLAAEQLYEKFDRNKTFKVSGEKLENWSKGFEEAGWTDSGDMRNLADIVYTSGGKNVQGDKGLEMAEQIAKVQAGKVGGLGLSPETFVRLIESKERLPKDSKQRQSLAEALGTSQEDKRLNSRKGREELLKAYSESAAIQKGIDSQPWIAASNAVDNLQKAIGKTLIPTMTTLVGWFTKFVNFLENVPGVPWLIGLGAIAVTVGGSIKLLSTTMQPLISIIGIAKTAMLGQAAAEVTVTAASRAASAAAKAESVAKMEEAIATRMSSQAGLSDTAISAQNAIAKRARAAADLAASRAAAINAIETSANTGSQAANTGAANLSTGARLRLAAATAYQSVATRISTAATAMSSAISGSAIAIYGALTGKITLATMAERLHAAASWASSLATRAAAIGGALFAGGLATLTTAEAAATTGATALAAAEGVAAAPLWPFIAGAAVLAGALAVLAAKAGFLKPLLDGFGKMKWGKAVDDFAKGDFGKAWQDLFKGFKFPSMGKMWDNLTKGMPDIGKMLGDIKLPSMGEIIKLPDIGKWISDFKLADIGKMLKLPKLGDLFKTDDLGKSALKIALSVATLPILGPILLIGRVLDKIFGTTDSAKTIIETGMSLWKKMVEFLTWLYDAIKGGLKWIRDGLGITKQEKEKKLDTYATQHEYREVDYGAVSEDDPDWYRGKGFYDAKNKKVQDDQLSLLVKARDEAPKGFFEGIPGMSDLTDRMGKLTTAIEAWKLPSPSEIPAAASNAVSSNSGLFDTSSMSEEERKSEGFWDASVREGKSILSGLGIIPSSGTPTPSSGTPTPSSGTPSVPDKAEWIANQMKTPGITQKQAEDSWKHNYPGYAKGTASVPKTEPAIVHEGERIIPAMDNKALTNVLGRIQPSREVASSRATNIQVAGSTFNINNPVVPDVGAAYQLTDILKRQLDPFIEESVKRKIGQYIT